MMRYILILTLTTITMLPTIQPDAGGLPTVRYYRMVKTTREVRREFSEWDSVRQIKGKYKLIIQNQ